MGQCLPLAGDCEITVEGRNINFGPEKIEACLEAGANRFSLGVQTFNTELRHWLGRISSREEVIAHLENLAQYNQAAIAIDLIYGLPGQTIEDWADDEKRFWNCLSTGSIFISLACSPAVFCIRPLKPEKSHNLHLRLNKIAIF